GGRTVAAGGTRRLEGTVGGGPRSSRPHRSAKRPVRCPPADRAAEGADALGDGPVIGPTAGAIGPGHRHGVKAQWINVLDRRWPRAHGGVPIATDSVGEFPWAADGPESGKDGPTCEEGTRGLRPCRRI